MKAYLILANGLVMEGKSIGAAGTTLGEVVFATGMEGYQEALTDPSFLGQLITQTYPLVGNYGINSEDFESDKIWCQGYIVRECCKVPSNFRCEKTLDEFLKEHNTVGIEGVDTRRLTRLLRESGVMNGAITTEVDPADEAAMAELMEKIKGFTIDNAVETVCCKEPYVVNPEGELHVALMDYGCKANIIRCLAKRGCKVTVMPAASTPEQVMALDPDGLMLTNGPGDPADNVQIIANIRTMLDTGIPAFGICLGHQLTALAAGATTSKMKYGHRGGNQPVTDFALDRTFITSQNHGYAVDGSSLPPEVGHVSHVNANDGTCEGMEYTKWNCFTVQFHPEACSGPKDVEFLFDRFVDRIKKSKEAKGNA